MWRISFIYSLMGQWKWAFRSSEFEFATFVYLHPLYSLYFGKFSVLQAGNSGFSIGAAKKANSLVIGPGSGYNLVG